MSDRDYYEILGLTPRADGPMVDQSYWHLARKYQQLATTNARGRKLLDDLNEAYGVLGNPRLRKEYDAFRDEVLVGKGVIGPVRATPEKRKKRGGKKEEAAPREPWVHMPAGWRVYGAAIGIAAASATGGVVFGATAIALGGLAAAVALAAVPVVRSRVRLSMPDLSMPDMPSMPKPNVALPKVTIPNVGDLAMPQVRAQKPDLSRVSQHLGADRDEALDPDELRASTAAVIARWRKSMGLRVLPGQQPAEEPSNELVEIVESERKLDEAESEPLMAAINILRGAHKKPTSTDVRD